MYTCAEDVAIAKLAEALLILVAVMKGKKLSDEERELLKQVVELSEEAHLLVK